MGTFDFLKNILGKKEPEIMDIAFDTIPSRLDRHEKSAHETLISTTQEPVRNIRNAAAQLQLIVNGIAGAEHDPALHPKIKSIAKNSLPLFVKAMNSSLAKEMPDDREEFYLAAVECVKGCLNGSRGQGRYLQMVFPEEMKSVKTGIDTMGREINGITAALSAYRRTMAITTEVRSLHATLITLKGDLDRSVEKDARSGRRIAELTARIGAIEQELEHLNTGEATQEIADQKSALAACEKARDDAIRQYAALSMTASHVFRKAEKLSQKEHNKPETEALRNAMELLSDHAMPDLKQLEEALNRACPVAERMITAGEIPLKNKEERAVFSDASQFCSDMCAAGRAVQEQEDACSAAGQKIAGHPLLTRIHSLEREKTQQHAMLVKEGQSKRELEGWRVGAKEQIPVLLEDLTKKMGIIEGDTVQVHITGA
ncbi:hypothetical protein [uncultured Methanoregula sp.]|uniref:hypothetical protein n=1 Tax=uncultured Methanoregula sp. TaxID=1005933 RepID=UPI002AAB8F7C|nr:hypothetical protein [uncultured Methanoregula sp.]